MKGQSVHRQVVLFCWGIMKEEYINRTHNCPECDKEIKVKDRLPLGVYWRAEKKEMVHSKCLTPRVLRETNFYGNYEKKFTRIMEKL